MFKDDFFEGRNLPKDSLTGLYNRESVVEYVNYLVENNTPFSMAMVDIDNFKNVNDNYGHKIGDIVIKAVANKLFENISKYGCVGRFGGDEFILVLPNIVEYDEVWTVCRSLAVNMRGFEIPELPEAFITITLGLARFPENEKSFEKLLELADKALYRGKMKGRNCFIIYLPEKHANIVLKTENDKSLSSMLLHSMVFKSLTSDTNLAEGIKTLFNFLSSYFMFDHICVQHNDKLYFDKVHPLSDNKEFAPIDPELLKLNFSAPEDMFYINQKDNLLRNGQTKLHEVLKAQKITSTFYAEISAYDKLYGYLRVDSVHQKIWQHTDMDILLTTAKTIAIILYDHNLTFETV